MATIEAGIDGVWIARVGTSVEDYRLRSLLEDGQMDRWLDERRPGRAVM